jgi:hypothetical protein
LLDDNEFLRVSLIFLLNSRSITPAGILSANITESGSHPLFEIRRLCGLRLPFSGWLFGTRGVLSRTLEDFLVSDAKD